MSFIGKTASFIRDGISIIIYAMIYFRKRAGRVTLLYHSIGSTSSGNDPYKLNVTYDVFASHMKEVASNGIESEVAFDDGYANNFTKAFPLLKKYSINATIFVVTDFIDNKLESEDLPMGWAGECALTWDEIRIMDRAGIKIGSHSCRHPILSGLTDDMLKNELSYSKRRIEEELGHHIDSLAFPFGGARSFDGRVIREAKAAGYKKAYTNMMGINRQDAACCFRLKRIRIYSEDTALKVRMKMAGAYDWVDMVSPLFS